MFNNKCFKKTHFSISNLMSKYLLLLFFILFLDPLYGQSVEDLTNKMITQYQLWDFIGCVETTNKLLPISKNKGEIYYYRSRSKFLLGDIKGAAWDLKWSEREGYRINGKAFKFWMDEDAKRKYLLKYFYRNEKVYPESGYRPKYERKDSLRGELRPERTCFDVLYYNLNIRINPRAKRIGGYNEITFRALSESNRIQLDLFPELTITSIEWGNQLLPFTREFNAVFITFPTPFIKSGVYTIKVNYSGKPHKAANPPWDGGFVWKRDRKRNWWCGVACEHLGASSWWPNKDHPSDEPDSMTLNFTVPNGYDCISNGRERKVTPVGKNYTTHTWFVANPINNYDATFYLGKFAHFGDTISNIKGWYPLDYYVMPFHLNIAKATFGQTKDILHFYESAFGPFPFMKDKFSLVEAPYEGMEHQGAIAYGNGYDKNKKTHEYANLQDDYIIVHESAHEWWGNSVTASDMADIWIQEGFATYAELLFLEHKYGHEEYLKQLATKISQIFNVWPVVQNYDVNEDAFASNDCYNKGAAILNNLRCCINEDSLFFKIIKDFALKYEKKIVTTQNFIDLVNDETCENYTPFFKKYLHSADLPVLKYNFRKEKDSVYMTYQWEGVEDGFKMPFCIATGDTSFRFEGTTKVSGIVLKNAKTFRFYTPLLGTDKLQPNSFTYFWTRCDNPEY